MEWSAGDGTKTSFEETQSLIRFAALLRPFMTAGSPLELVAFWKVLSEDTDLVGDENCQTIATLFAEAERFSGAFVLNEKAVTARDVYFAYAEGEFFDEKGDAKAILDQWSFGPFQQMVPFLFYSACSNYSNLVFVVLDVIIEVERCYPERAIASVSEPRCVYCLGRDGDFGSEEHVIPRRARVRGGPGSGLIC
jgi:hypothetical protein